MTVPTLESTEECVKKVWMSILHINNVAADQNFFELGGDSLLMIDMLFQLNEELKVEVDPTFLFEDASLSGFSRLVHQARGGGLAMQESTNLA